MKKTKKSISKRFKITSSGKLICRKPNHRHLLSNKSNKQKRAARKYQMVHTSFEHNLKIGLPFG